MGGVRWLGWCVVLAGLPGCGAPSLDLPSARGATPLLTFEPAAAPTAVAPVFRARVQVAPQGEPWLFRGALSDYHDRALRQGELSATLLERAVPLRYWREGGDCVLQPLQWLEPGADYALGLTGYGRLETLRVSSAELPSAARFFPAAGAPQHAAAVFCGAAFDEGPASGTLEPGGVSLHVETGAFGVARPDCVTLIAEGPLTEAVVPPPAWGGVLLEPAAFQPTSEQGEAVPCPAGQSLAGACLQVLDDRVLVTPHSGALLWSLTEPRETLLSLRRFERAELLGELAPGTSYQLVGQVLGASGESVTLGTRFTTGGERRHLVISEVLANAVGPEPESEWIELVNDSARPVALAGLWLEDGAGGVPLPQQELAPGEIALLVGTPFRASALDVPPAEAVRLVALPTLGVRGLANSGEPLLLVGEEGVLSRFPMLAAAHAGRSVARRSLDAADDDPLSFAAHGAPGASPGRPNTFD